jgi:hypothetical protein
MFGREPRTTLAANLDWSSSDFCEKAFGMSAATYEDYNDVIAIHHESMNAVHNRVMLATSLAQALTKRAWDATRKEAVFKLGEHVLIHRTAPNRLLPHFTGPFTVDSVSSDMNFVTVRHYVDKEKVTGPVHVSRLLHFDASRADPTDIIDFQLEPGSFVVSEVLDHRQLADGSYEFHLAWKGTPITTWRPEKECRSLVKVKDYCATKGITISATAAVGPRAIRHRGRRKV